MTHDANGAPAEHPNGVSNSTSTHPDGFNFNFQTIQSGQNGATSAAHPWELADGHVGGGYHVLDQVSPVSLTGVEGLPAHGNMPETVHPMTVEGASAAIQPVVHDHHFIL